jgi:hypothetical protein
MTLSTVNLISVVMLVMPSSSVLLLLESRTRRTSLSYHPDPI